MSNEDDGVSEECISAATDLLQLHKQVGLSMSTLCLCRRSSLQRTYQNDTTCPQIPYESRGEASQNLCRSILQVTVVKMKYDADTDLSPDSEEDALFQVRPCVSHPQPCAFFKFFFFVFPSLAPVNHSRPHSSNRFPPIHQTFRSSLKTILIHLAQLVRRRCTCHGPASCPTPS